MKFNLETIVYAALAYLIATALLEENATAAGAWTAVLALDILATSRIKTLQRQLYAAGLFIKAHNEKWPSKAMQDEAQEEYKRFVQEQQ
jgi:hypothetical protein